MPKNKYKNNAGNKNIKGGTLIPFHKEGNTTYFRVLANDPFKTDSVLVGPNNKNGIALDNNEIVKETKNHIEVASDDLGTTRVIESLSSKMPLPDAFRQGYIKQELYKKENNITNSNKMKPGGFANKNISIYEDKSTKQNSNNLIYKIKKGDSLISIARKFGLNSIDELVKLNNIKNPNLMIGNDLILPDYVTAESSIKPAVITAEKQNYNNTDYNNLPKSVKDKVNAYTQAFNDNKIKFNEIPEQYKQQVYNNNIRQGVNKIAPHILKNVLLSPFTVADTPIRAGINEGRKLLTKNSNNDYGIKDYFGNFSFLGKDFEQKHPVTDAILNTIITPTIMGAGENIAAKSMDNALNKSLKAVNSNIKNNAKAVANLAGVEEMKIAPVATKTNIKNGSIYNSGNKGIGKTGNVRRGQISSYKAVQSNKGTFNHSASYSPRVKTTNAKTTNIISPFIGNRPYIKNGQYVGNGYYVGTNVPINEQKRVNYIIQEPQENKYSIKETIPANPWIYGKVTSKNVPYKVGTEVPIYYEMNAPEGTSIKEQPIIKEYIIKKTGNAKRKAELIKGKITGTPTELHSGYGYTYGNEGGPLIYMPRQSFFTGGRTRMANGGDYIISNGKYGIIEKTNYKGGKHTRPSGLDLSKFTKYIDKDGTPYLTYEGSNIKINGVDRLKLFGLPEITQYDFDHIPVYTNNIYNDKYKQNINNSANKTKHYPVSTYEDRPIKNNDFVGPILRKRGININNENAVEKQVESTTKPIIKFSKNKQSRLRSINKNLLTNDYTPTDIAPSKEIEDITLDNTVAKRVGQEMLNGNKYLSSIDVLNPIKRQVQSPVKIGVYNIGKSGPSFGDKLRLGWDKFKKFMSTPEGVFAASAATDITGNIIASGIERRAIDSTKYAPAPIQNSTSKMLTNYNINPQLASIRNEAANAQRDITENTLSSKVRQNRLNLLGLNTALNTNQLYANKENIETQLINQDTTNQQNIRNSNIDSYNKWLAAKTEFDNNKILNKANSTVSAISGIGNALGNYASNLLQAQQFTNNVDLYRALNPDAAKVVPTANCGGRYNKKRRK